MSIPPIRVLAFLESFTVTGPAKNLIEFAIRARNPADGQRPVFLEAGAYVRDGSTNAYIQALEAAEIPVHIIREKRVGDWGALRQLSEIVDRVEPDVVQSHNCKSHFFVRLSERWRRVPWVGFHHGYTSTNLKTLVYNQFDRYSLRRTARLVTVCQPFLQQLSGFGLDPSRISVIHNSVKEFRPPPAQDVENVRRHHGIRADRPVVLSVGRLSHEKAHRDLVEALSILRKRATSLDPQLVFVGDGHEAAALRRQVSDAALGDAVVFCGQQSNVRPFYAMADAFALPSLSEGSPNALLEAMAAGVPSVATRVGGVPEIATDRETALLVYPSNPTDLAAALEALLADRETAGEMALRAKQHVLDRFSPVAQTEALRRVYLDALDKPR